MAVTVSVDLDALKVPGIAGYTPVFGTLKPSGESLTTLEVVDNMALSYLKQRNIVVELSSDTAVTVSKIEYSGTLLLVDSGIPASPEPSLVVTLPAPVNNGDRITVINSTTYDVELTWAGNTGSTLKIFGDTAQEFVQSSIKWYKLGSPTVKNGTLYL